MAEPGATVQHQNSPDEVADKPTHRKAARDVRALVLARMYEALPLVHPQYGHMRMVANINDGPALRAIHGALGEPTSARHPSAACGPPLTELPATERAERENDP